MVGYTVTAGSKAAAASTAAAAVILTFPPSHPWEENRLYNLHVCLEDKKSLIHKYALELADYHCCDLQHLSKTVENCGFQSS